MKILHINGNKEWGGSEQQMFSLVIELNKLEVHNFIFAPFHSKIHQYCIQNEIKFIGSKSEKLNQYVNYFYLKKIVKSYQPDIIHLHSSDALTVYVVSDFLFSLKTKTVFSKKSMGSKSSFFSKYKYNYKNINQIICISKFIKSDFSKILSHKNIDKIKIIYDCIQQDIINKKASFDIRIKYNISKNIFLIGNIANHNKAKDIKTLIFTLDFLVNQMNIKDIKFIQVGYHSVLTKEYLKLVEEKNLKEYIIFTEAIQDAYVLNHQFDAFLLSSEREGGPTVVLEAMLFELPVISTKVGFIPEIIENGVNGYYADVKDYKGLAREILEVKSNKSISKQQLLANKNLVQNNFNASKIATETLETYEILLS